MNNLSLNYITKSQDFVKKILFTLIILVVYRLGSYIPLPYINSHVLSHVTAENSQGILGMLNMLSGGSLGRMSIFSLAIMPYITSSIIIQLLSIISKNLENLKKEGEIGRKKINQYTKYLTIILAAFQAYGITLSIQNISYNSIFLVEDNNFLFKFVSIVTLTGGTILLMWLGEQITSNGIGNGISLIIYSGIISGFPASIIKFFELLRIGSLSPISMMIVLLMIMVILFLIIFIEKSQRKIIVQYAKRQIGNKLYGGERSHIPLKLNTAGVIPPIFASSILLFPLTIVKFSKTANFPWLENLILYLDHGKPLYIILYSALIVFFSFFYTAIIFNSQEAADNLKKANGFLIGIKPGKNTINFFDYVLTRINIIGSIYLAFVCIFPEIIISNYSIPFYLSGTSILIVVNVVIETINQIQVYLFTNQYQSMIKKAKLREKYK